MVHIQERAIERVALWPWRNNDCRDKSAITADDLHFWVEEPNAPQANLDLADFLHSALVTVACSAFAVSAFAVAQVDAEDVQRLLQVSSGNGHEDSAQCSAVAAAPVPEKEAQPRWADLDDSESEEGSNSSDQKPLEEEVGQIQENEECSDALGAARKEDGESQVDTSLPSVRAFFGSRSEPVDGKALRPRWGDIDDSESDDLTVVDPNFSEHKRLEDEGLRIHGGCDDGEDKAEVAEVPGQRRSKATRGKRGGVKRNAGRHAAQNNAGWDAASQKQSKASSSWEKGAWASAPSQQISTQAAASWQQNGWAASKTWADSSSWGQHEWVPRPRKWQCQFIVGIDEEPVFRVVRRLLGPAGKNVKAIAEETGAKLRLRGVGSKFLEGPEKLESTDPLMLCVSTSTEPGYNTAAHMVQEILERIYAEYQEFQLNNGVSMPLLGIQMHVGAREYF